MGIYTLRQEESSQKIQLNPLIFDNLVMAEAPLVDIYLVCMVRQEESPQKIQLNPLIFYILVIVEVPLVEIYLVCMELLCSIFGSFVIIPCTLFISYQLVPNQMARPKMMTYNITSKLTSLLKLFTILTSYLLIKTHAVKL